MDDDAFYSFVSCIDPLIPSGSPCLPGQYQGGQRLHSRRRACRHSGALLRRGARGGASRSWKKG